MTGIQIGYHVFLPLHITMLCEEPDVYGGVGTKRDRLLQDIAILGSRRVRQVLTEEEKFDDADIWVERGLAWPYSSSFFTLLFGVRRMRLWRISGLKEQPYWLSLKDAKIYKGYGDDVHIDQPTYWIGLNMDELSEAELEQLRDALV